MSHRDDPLEFYRISLELETSELSLFCEEPDQCVYEQEGRILRVDDSEEPVEVGRLGVFYVDFEAGAEAGLTPAEVLDAHGETEEYTDAVLDADGEPWSESLVKLLDGEFPGLNF